MKLDPKRNPDRLPPTLPVIPRGIPRSMRRERRWMLWRWVWSHKKWTKVPYQASGSYAKSDDPKTWTDFDSALAALHDGTGRFDGIGFALNPERPEAVS